jgi:hypothetical protein
LYGELKDSYSETGRPSIDPELLLRILLIGYLYGIASERKLVEELRMHLAWRWFTGLGFDQETPHHSTFSKNRHGRFHESNLFEQLFEQIVSQCEGVSSYAGTQSRAFSKDRDAPTHVLALTLEFFLRTTTVRGEESQSREFQQTDQLGRSVQA